MSRSLFELTRMRLLLLVRQPEIVFWAFVFPVMLSMVLGFACTSGADSETWLYIAWRNGEIDRGRLGADPELEPSGLGLPRRLAECARPQLDACGRGAPFGSPAGLEILQEPERPALMLATFFVGERARGAVDLNSLIASLSLVGSLRFDWRNTMCLRSSKPSSRRSRRSGASDIVVRVRRLK